MMTIYHPLESHNTVLKQTMADWHAYWQANPRRVKNCEPYPFLIFQPSFAKFHKNHFKPSGWARKCEHPTKHQCGKPLSSRTVKRMQREVIVTNPETNTSNCIERIQQILRHYKHNWIPKSEMSANISSKSSPSKTARPPKASSRFSSKQYSNLPPLSPNDDASLPEASVTTIRGNHSRNTRRELRCRGSMVLIPSKAGSYSVPCPLPKIRTKVFVNIGPRECVVTIELDSRAILTSLLASYELTNELVRISYERVMVVNQLHELAPCVLNPTDSAKSSDLSPERATSEKEQPEQEEEYDYEVTTRVDHSFRFPTAFYVLQAIRVKQLESVVYIHVPRIKADGNK